MKRLYILYVLLLLVLTGCTKDEGEIRSSVFGEKTLQSPGGSFLVMFKGTGMWSVSSDCDWLHTENRLYRDEAAFEVTYDSNESSIGDHRFCRLGHVNVVSEDGSWKRVLVVRQEGLAPYIYLETVTVPQESGIYRMRLETNLTDKERHALTFSSDVSWISDITLGWDGQTVFMKVSSGSSRSGNVTICFTDEWKRRFSVSATVTQQ